MTTTSHFSLYNIYAYWYKTIFQEQGELIKKYSYYVISKICVALSHDLLGGLPRPFSTFKHAPSWTW